LGQSEATDRATSSPVDLTVLSAVDLHRQVN